jgi:predicted lipid-binding transport protein (Tim44 family)
MLEAVLGLRHAPPDPRDPAAPVFEAVPVVLPLPSAPPSSVHDATALAVLTAADPAFVPDDLCRHSAAAFCALRSAWAALDTAAVRPYLNDSAEHELATDMQALRDRGLRRVADDPLVTGTVIVHADDADGLVTVTVAVQAELIDADTDGSGSLVRGDRVLQDVEQPLTFRRHSRAGSPGAGVVVLRCSRCGAPLRAAGVEHCEYCHQAIADGGGEWALIDIAPMAPHVNHPLQAEAPAPPAASAGEDAGVVAVIAASFPGFNDHEFLALARESFYAVESATTHLDPTLSAAHVTDAFAAQQAVRLEQLRSRHHHVVLAFLDLAGAHITALGDDGAVMVRFDISAQDAERDDLTGAIVSGAPEVHTWPESWAFQPSPTGRPWRVSAVSLIVG